MGKKVVENLIDAGSFDFTKWTRQELLESVEPMFEQTSRRQKEEAKGVMDFFSIMETEESHPFLTPPKVALQQDKREILMKEKEFLGFFLTGHPMDAYRTIMKGLQCLPFHEIHEVKSGSPVKTAFIIEGVKVKISQRTEKKFAIVDVSDGMERFELPIWPDMYEKFHHLIYENRLLFAIVQVEKEEDATKLRCRYLEDLANLSEEDYPKIEETFKEIEKFTKSDQRRKKKQGEKDKMNQEKSQTLRVTLDVDTLRLSEIVSLKKIFHQFPGAAEVHVVFQSGGNKVGNVEIESKWGIGWNDQLENRLKALSCIQAFSFEG